MAYFIGPLTAVGTTAINVAPGTASTSIGNTTGTLTLTGVGAFTSVGTAAINTTGTASTSIGNATGTLTLTGASINLASGVLNADSISSASSNTNLSLQGNGTGVVDVTDSLKTDSLTAHTTNGALAMVGNGTGGFTMTANPSGALLTKSTTGTHTLISEYLHTVTTSNATPTAISTFAIGTDEMVFIEVTVTAKQAATTGAGWKLMQAFYRASGGTLSALDTQSKVAWANGLAWDASLVVSGTNVLVQVTGAAATTIVWESTPRWNKHTTAAN